MIQIVIPSKFEMFPSLCRNILTYLIPGKKYDHFEDWLHRKNLESLKERRKNCERYLQSNV